MMIRSTRRQCQLIIILSVQLYAVGAFHTESFSLLRPGSTALSLDPKQQGIQHPLIRPREQANGVRQHLLLASSSSLRAGGGNEDAAPVVSNNGGANNKVSQLAAKILQYADKNYFLVGMLVAVTMAKIFPALGKNGGILRPEILIGNYGVSIIFLLSGFSLQTSDLAKAISNVKLNGLVNILLFGVWPFCIGLPLRYVFTNVLPNLIPSGLADGLLVMTTLPTTVNMCIMLTSASGGNAASAICNAVISNLAGILLTPLLLLKFFGATIKLPFGKMVLKLCQKVLLPVTIGQFLRTSGGAKTFYKTHSKTFKRLQETVLLGIVWNAFCNAFSDGLGIQFSHSLVLLGLLPMLHLAVLAASFKFFSLSWFGFTKGETIAAMFCSSQKTLAFGLPLINTIFQGNPNLALYCAPLMFIHPLQMAIGSFLLPTVQKYVEED
jgi:sodium/bile acid cotransporter 7